VIGKALWLSFGLSRRDRPARKRPRFNGLLKPVVVRRVRGLLCETDVGLLEEGPPSGGLARADQTPNAYEE
jgi:hypothetical protein